jgi:ATP dependent DNA ligase C terminal region/ATP dependent DNA ligase domain
MTTATDLLDRGRFEIKLGEYGVGTAQALTDANILAKTQDYRRLAGSRMYPLGKSDVRSKIPKADYHVSRKIDGEFTVLVLRDGQVFSINPGGTVRIGLPWQAEALAMFKKAGVKEAMIAGELYVHNTERRPRVHDVATVARQPQSLDDISKLRFGVFDVISIDGEPASESYPSTWQTIESVFGGGELIHPVETRLLSDTAGIEQLFKKWVEDEGAEGVVVRSDNAGLFKVKPRHTLDAVVVGFTESVDDRAGMMHDLLLAVMREDGTLQILCRVGGGFSDDLRRSMLSDLKDMVVSSEYAEVNSDYVAYQMVRPDWVIEISCLDLISQTTRGGHINRMVLEFDPQAGYRVVRRLPLVTVISPQFVRMREDKQAHPHDVRLAQVSDRVEVALTDCDAKNFKLPATEVLKREVFIKAAKGETMVRKFVLLKTNKEAEAEEYPAYVMHYTDFSPNRKDPLAREVMVSNSLAQIEQLFEQSKAENIKKGWNPVGDAVAASEEPPPKAAPKKATKKVAAKDDTVKEATETPPQATRKRKAK